MTFGTKALQCRVFHSRLTVLPPSSPSLSPFLPLSSSSLPPFPPSPSKFPLSPPLPPVWPPCATFAVPMALEMEAFHTVGFPCNNCSSHLVSYPRSPPPLPPTVLQRNRFLPGPLSERNNKLLKMYETRRARTRPPARLPSVYLSLPLPLPLLRALSLSISHTHTVIIKQGGRADSYACTHKISSTRIAELHKQLMILPDSATAQHASHPASPSNIAVHH